MDHELGKNSSEKIGLFWDDTATRVWSLKGNTYQLLKQNTLSLAVYEYRTESFTDDRTQWTYAMNDKKGWMVFRRQTNKFAQTQNWLQNFSNLCIEKLLDIYFAITSRLLYKVEFQGFISRKLVPKRRSKNGLLFYQIFQEKSFSTPLWPKKKQKIVPTFGGLHWPQNVSFRPNINFKFLVNSPFEWFKSELLSKCAYI